MAIYNGADIHAYTSMIRDVLNEQFSADCWQEAMTEPERFALLRDMKQHYPKHPAIGNIRQCVKNGKLLDPELPPVNFLLVLQVLWTAIQEKNSYSHFKETLDQISTTCIQGVTHRILIDWVAFHKGE
jgi:hypothetical protein